MNQCYDWNLMTLPTTLYTLQQHELTVDLARARLDEIEQILKNVKQVTRLKNEFDNHKVSLQEAQTTVKDLELEIASLTQKIQDVDELLYSGTIKNPKELTDRQDELLSLQRRLEVRQESLMLAGKDVDDRKVALEQVKEKLELAKEENEQRNQDLLAEQKTLNKEIKSNLRERKSLVGKISKKDYTFYRQLRKKLRGQAVAAIEHDEICSYCHVGQTTSAIQDIKRNTEFIYCGNCGRILVSVE